MIHENKIAKILDLGRPRNLYPSKICTYTVPSILVPFGTVFANPVTYMHDQNYFILLTDVTCLSHKAIPVIFYIFTI